jgi:hypothetical protein
MRLIVCVAVLLGSAAPSFARGSSGSSHRAYASGVISRKGPSSGVFRQENSTYGYGNPVYQYHMHKGSKLP